MAVTNADENRCGLLARLDDDDVDVDVAVNPGGSKEVAGRRAGGDRFCHQSYSPAE